jgi:hypothetical protein
MPAKYTREDLVTGIYEQQKRVERAERTVREEQARLDKLLAVAVAERDSKAHS